MPEPTEAPSTTPAEGAPAGTANPTAKAPTWEGDFDPEKAAKLVANLRSELSDVKGRLKTREDAEKTDLQKAQERAEAAEKALSQARTEALVAKAARKYGIPDEFADLLSGTPEQIEERAKKLGERFNAPKSDPIPGRPKPKLVPGHAPNDDAADFDPAATAKAVRAARGY